MPKLKPPTPPTEKRKARPPVRKSVPTCLKAPDVATILGISRARAYELVNSDGFPRIVMGKRIIIPRQAFKEWMTANTVTQKQSDLTL